MNLYKTFIIFILVFLIGFFSIGSVKAQELNNIQSNIHDANKDYVTQNYSQAISNYKKALASGFKNASLYYNLANAYYKNGNIAEAILNYKNALIFDPRNADIKANLKFVLEKSENNEYSLIDYQSAQKTIFFWFFNLNLAELILLTIVLNFIICVSLAFNMIFDNFIWKTTNYMGLLLVFVLIISCGLKIYYNYNPTEGIIIADNTELKSGNNYAFSTIFTLNSAKCFKILEKQDDWYKISFNDQKKGWVNQKSIQIVDAHM